MKGPCPICNNAVMKTLQTPYGQHQRAFCPHCRCRMRFAPNGELTYARADFEKRNYGLPTIFLLGGAFVLAILYEKIGFLGVFFSISMLGLGILAMLKFIINLKEQKFIAKRLDELGLQSGQGHKNGETIEAQRQVESFDKRRRNNKDEEDDSDFF